ncbi:MAG TPA: hypothetical protein VKA68_17030 [bacterium]|nr:hypothetical protein [bacterium]
MVTYTEVSLYFRGVVYCGGGIPERIILFSNAPDKDPWQELIFASHFSEMETVFLLWVK